MESMCGGGAEKVLTTLLSNLDSKRYAVSLLLLNATGPNISDLPDNVELIALNGENSFFIKHNLLYKRHFRRALWKFQTLRAVGRQRYDTIISFLEGPSTLIHSFLMGRAGKNISWVHTNFRTNPWAATFYNPGEERDIYSRMDSIVFVSAGAKEAFKDLLGLNGRFHVIPNIIDRNAIIAKAGEECIDSTGFTICNIGRLAEPKRHDRLIKVAAELKRRRLDFTVWILGTGRLESRLRQLAKSLEVDDRIRFLGFKKNPYPYLKAADIFLLTSDTEGYPTVVCEALCLDKPVVSTAITGSDELLAGGTGILTSFDVSEIADRVETLIQDPGLLDHYAGMSHKQSLRFGSEAIISEIEKLV